MNKDNKVYTVTEDTVPQIDAATIARTINLFLSLASMVIVMAGGKALNIDPDSITTLVVTGWAVISSVIAWWKDNPFTPSARLSNQVKNDLRDGAVVTVQQGDNLTVMDSAGEVNIEGVEVENTGNTQDA